MSPDLRKLTMQCLCLSTGVILYILLSGKVPFYGKTTNDMLDSTLRGRYHFNDTVWLTVTDDAKKCVERMLTYDPEERVTAQEMLGTS